MDYIPSEMLRGHLDTIILLSLSDSDKHSNQIKEFVENRSGGQFVLKQGTFYSCLQRIVKQGFVTEYRTTDEDGVRRKFFQLTEKGKTYIDENVNSWSFSKQVIDQLISSDETVNENTAKKVNVSDQAESSHNEIKESAVEKPAEIVVKETKKEAEPAKKVQKEIASIDYTQAETFFNNDAKEETVVDFEQLSFDKPVEALRDDPAKSVGRASADAVEPVVEKKEVHAEKREETHTVLHEVKKEENDDDSFSASDQSVDYRTILEGIFPSSKPGHKKDARELTYEEGVDVEKFFNDDDKKTPSKKVNPTKKPVKTVKNDTDKHNRPVEKAQNIDKSASTYDFSDIQNLADEEGFKISISSNENKKDIGRILINKLNFYSSLIIFGIFAIEAMILFAATSVVAGLNFIPYLIFIVACAAFPLVNGTIYFIKPNKKTRQISSFKNSIELIIIICLNLLLIDVVSCVLTSIDFSSYKDLTRYLFYPIIFIATLPFYVVIKYLLLERNYFYE